MAAGDDALDAQVRALQQGVEYLLRPDGQGIKQVVGSHHRLSRSFQRQGRGGTRSQQSNTSAAKAV